MVVSLCCMVITWVPNQNYISTWDDNKKLSHLIQKDISMRRYYNFRDKVTVIYKRLQRKRVVEYRMS